MDITVVIPSYGRNKVLVSALEQVLCLRPSPAAVVVVDQTPLHSPAVETQLKDWSETGAIRWLRLQRASQPHAANIGLLAAETDYVLFLDDDVILSSNLIEAYATAIHDMQRESANCWCIVGQIIQPDQEEIEFELWSHNWFPFHSNKRQFIEDSMSGNMCVNRIRALKMGGFDENYHGSAYKFDSDFARRVIRAGGKILFEPRAGIRHLRVERGGTRSYGHHLTTWKPYHAVGKYYFGLRGGMWEATKTLLVQPWRAIRTRHHLRRPWCIPATLIAELLGICWALWLCARRPRLIRRGGEFS